MLRPYQALFAASAIQLALSHSWVERVNVASNGYLEIHPAGYARGNVLRTAPGFNDELMTYQLPPDGRVPSQILPTDTICAPSQRYAEQTDGSPRLNVTNGQTIALQFNENGHITKPWNNPIGKDGPGNVYVYGTNQSEPTDTLLDIFGVWTEDGSGGNQRGQLLYQASFDDGMCYQYSDAASGYSPIESHRASLYPGPGSIDPAQNQNRWCLARLNLPELPAGSLYTLYWVWYWPFVNTKPAQELVYTTCIDIDVSLE